MYNCCVGAAAGYQLGIFEAHVSLSRPFGVAVASYVFEKRGYKYLHDSKYSLRHKKQEENKACEFLSFFFLSCA